MNKAQTKRIELGEKLYEEFVKTMADNFFVSSYVSNPRTQDLEKYALLEKKGLPDILFLEMAKEYLTNFLEVELSVENGRLLHSFKTKALM